MSTYDNNLSDNTDIVRFLTGDTDDDFQMLSDAEISWLLGQENDNVMMAASRACIAIAGKYARDVNYRFSTMWQDSGDAFEHYMNLSKTYEQQADKAEELDIGFLRSPALQNRFDDDLIELFWYGMHDNPPASQTD